MRRIVVCFIVFLFLPASLAAQSGSSPRMWAGAGQGSFGCWESFRCDFNEFYESRNVISGFAGADVSIARRLRAGLEITSRSAEKGDVDIRMQTASALLAVQPLARVPLRFRGNIGLAWRKASGPMDDIIVAERGTGRLMTVGATYDIPLHGRLSLTPGAEIGGVDFGDERWSKQWAYRLALTWSAHEHRSSVR